MADSLNPWMAAYLIDIAESLGAKYYDAPRHERPKKVQIIEVLSSLTYPKDEQETAIWVRVSDKKHLVIIKFSADAVADFNQCSSTRFTQNKGALIKISKFKPLFTKYPIGKDRISSVSAICLDCQQVSLLGAALEPTFGKPTDIHHESDIQEWSKGLAKDGGAGNILKERKVERDVAPLASVTPLSQMAPPPTPNRPVVVKVVEPPRAEDVDSNSYAKQWKILGALLDPDWVVPAFSRDDEKPMSELTGGSSLHPRSGSGVEGSRSSPQMSKQAPSEKQVSSQEGTSSQSLPEPTPAQRTRPTNYRTPDQPISSFPSLDETQVSPTRRTDMSRKVPRPVSPEPAREVVGPVRVLVANSDIASQPTQLSQGMPEIVIPWMKTSEILDIMRSTTRHRLHKSEHT